MKIAVVTDSTAYLSAEQIKENDIHIVLKNFMKSYGLRKLSLVPHNHRSAN